jgi:hypothetical protein
MFLLDALDNLPQLRISDSLMKVFLWVLREGGARDVPSFDALRKLQKKLNKECGVPSTQHESCQGNIFFVNDPRTLVAQVRFLTIVFFAKKLIWLKAFSNPLVRPHLHLYPEIPDGPITEVWHAEKWRKTFDSAILAPMYDNEHGRHYYINELARTRNDNYMIPIRWVNRQGKMHADAFTVILDNEVRCRCIIYSAAY